MLKTSEDLGGMLRGRLPFDGVKFADGALKLDSLSHQPWQHFPQRAMVVTAPPAPTCGSARRGFMTWLGSLKASPANWLMPPAISHWMLRN